MKIFNIANRFFSDPVIRFNYLTKLGVFNMMPDDKFLKKKFNLILGYPLDLKHPCTFNEKLQWLKINDRNPNYTKMVDKYAVREYIANKIGEKYLIPLLGVWDDPESIDFSSLPNQFAMKCNHNSGLGMCICKNKNSLNIQNVKQALKKGLAQNYYLSGREWPYKDVPRKIIAEKFLVDDSGKGLRDYKVLCFEGEPKLIEYHLGRFTDHQTQDFYDVNWNKTDIVQVGERMSDHVAPKPELLDEMLELSRILSKDIPHVRVDWYISGGQLYFGELTFFDASGFDAFVNMDHDKLLGSWIKAI